MPSVSRAWPVCMSMPTSPMAKPSNRLTSPRSIDEPSTAVTVVKASSISAK